MKFIDDKGRLFGVVNIFDMLVLFIILASALLAVKWARVAEDPSWMKVKICRARCIGLIQLPAYVAELVKEGDEIRDPDGLVQAKISRIISADYDITGSTKITYASKDGEKIFLETENNDKYSSNIKSITVLVDLAAYERKGDVYLSSTNVPFRVGDSISFMTKKYATQISVRKILSDGCEK
jgi:hypothetical protein